VVLYIVFINSMIIIIIIIIIWHMSKNGRDTGEQTITILCGIFCVILFYLPCNCLAATSQQH